ncbi:MAG: phosphoribosylanthranilate isomerase [Mobilitalea sp.]
MTKIKICGLRRQEDIESVNLAEPDYVGFVFTKSKRQISAKEAGTLKARLNPNIQAVGVFVNEEISKILELVKEGIIDLVQLHGDEDAEYIKHLASCTTAQIIKAIRVKDQESLNNIKQIPVDYLLFDTYRNDHYGGSGERFDWSLISYSERRYFLAGGINIENAEMAIRLTKPYGIDISSGVETDGYKDREKIINFVKKVRAI